MLQTDTWGIEEFLVPSTTGGGIHTTNPIIDGIPGVPGPVVRNRLLFCVGEARLLQKVTVFFIKKKKKIINNVRPCQDISGDPISIPDDPI